MRLGEDITCIWVLKLLRGAKWPEHPPEAGGNGRTRVSPLSLDEERDKETNFVFQNITQSYNITQEAPCETWWEICHVERSQPLKITRIQRWVIIDPGDKKSANQEMPHQLNHYSLTML